MLGELTLGETVPGELVAGETEFMEAGGFEAVFEAAHSGRAKPVARMRLAKAVIHLEVLITIYLPNTWMLFRKQKISVASPQLR
jgi:hypothetical protein